MTVSIDSYKKIRIFVASPADVAVERQKLHSLVLDLNQTGSIVDQLGFVLEVLDWSTHVAPAMGRPEGIILEQLPVKEWDLFIGILWMRFGSPTGGIDPDSGEKFTSGTQEEFELAYKSLQKNNRPHIHFYRCNKAFIPSKVDWEQSGNVDSFFKKFEHDGERPGLYELYKNESEFEKKVQKNIVKYLEVVSNEMTRPIPVHVVREKTYTRVDDFFPEKRIKEELKEGDIYQMAFLSIDVCNSGKLIRKYSEKKIKLILNNYYTFVIEAIKGFKSDIFSWTGDGGILAFWGDDACNNAVFAGIKIMKELALFNLKRKMNPIKEEIKLRLAIHYGTIEFQLPMNNIVSDCISHVSHLEKYHTNPGTLAITDILYNNLDERLKDVFVYDKKYLNTSIFTYTEGNRTSLSKVKMREAEIKKVIDRINEQSDRLLNDFKKTDISKFSDSNSDLIRENIELLYNDFEYFYQSFAQYDTNWSKSYFRKLIKHIHLILDTDERIYQGVEDLSIELKLHNPEDSNFSSILKFVGLLRLNPVPNLKYLLSQFKKQLSDVVEIGYISKKSLKNRINKLIEADDFTEEVAFIDLFLNERENLVDYLSNNEHGLEYRKLISRLWALADFVLIDDLAILKSRQKSQPTAIFQVLASVAGMTKYFNVALELLIDKNLKPNMQSIRSCFEKYEINPSDTDLLISSKCLLIHHSDRKFRRYLLQNIGIDKCWEIISYSKTPLRVVQDVCEYLNLQKMNNKKNEYDSTDLDDSMKIFFDLIQKRLINDINEAESETPLFQIRLMIVIFYKFDFFVEGGYFDRLERLHLCFNSKGKEYPGIKIEDLEKDMDELKQERKVKGNPLTTIPKGLNKLPLPIQRRLAKEGRYVKFFISSNHHLIAKETYRYINLNNIEQVLAARNINRVLLSLLFSNPDLFRKNSTIYRAINHPGCNLNFATKYARKLSKAELKRVSNNPNANTEVRNYIKTILQD